MKIASSNKTNRRPLVNDFRPYRVLFLVVVTSVTCLVLFAVLSIS